MIKEYSNGALRVRWEPKKCIHSERCWRGLIRVFNPKKKPWIDLEGDSKERVMEQIDQCPSGALSYLTEEPHRAVEAQNIMRITVKKNGPYFVDAPLEIVDGDGNIKLEERRIALCRCGHSNNKPYCDGSHRENDFQG